MLFILFAIIYFSSNESLIESITSKNTTKVQLQQANKLIFTNQGSNQQVSSNEIAAIS